MGEKISTTSGLVCLILDLELFVLNIQILLLLRISKSFILPYIPYNPYNQIIKMNNPIIQINNLIIKINSLIIKMNNQISKTTIIQICGGWPLWVVIAC